MGEAGLIFKSSPKKKAFVPPSSPTLIIIIIFVSSFDAASAGIVWWLGALVRTPRFTFSCAFLPQHFGLLSTGGPQGHPAGEQCRHACLRLLEWCVASFGPPPARLTSSFLSFFFFLSLGSTGVWAFLFRQLHSDPVLQALCHPSLQNCHRDKQDCRGRLLCLLVSRHYLWDLLLRHQGQRPKICRRNLDV